jgi:hypothetical protein
VLYLGTMISGYLRGPKLSMVFPGIEFGPLLAAPINVLVCKFGPSL